MTAQLRSLVSFVRGGAAAGNAHRDLALAGFDSDLIANSSRRLFLPRRPEGVAGQRSIEDYETVVHIGEGGIEGFRVAERSEGASGGSAFVTVSELAPGSGRARYFWLVACIVMAHGRDVRDPASFCGARGEPNVFDRWGRARRIGGRDVAPLGAGIRLVCGGSTVLFGGPEFFSPIFRLAAAGFMLADAFIVGLTADGRTPLCATVAGRDRGTNPLFDPTWSRLRNPPGDRMFIQYPVSTTDSRDFSPFGLPGPPEPVPVSRPPGHDPRELPILKIEIDGRRQSAFADVARAIGEGRGLSAEHLVDQGTLLVSREAEAAGPDPGAIDPVRELIGELSARQSVVGVDRLDGQRNRIRVFKQHIDSFPLAALPRPDDPFPLKLVDREVKALNLVASPVTRDRLAPEANYQVLDPDLDAALYFDPLGAEDLAGGGDLRLLARSWNFVEDADAMTRLIGVEAAGALALKQVADAFPELLDLDVTNVRETVEIVYRFYPPEGPGRGELRPHYLVTITFPAGVGAGEDGGGVSQTASVEMPASMDAAR